MAVAGEGEVKAGLPLSIAGLMSVEPVDTVRLQLDRLLEVACEMESTLDDPFMTISFLGLPVIPELKITDKGMEDVGRFKVVALSVG